MSFPYLSKKRVVIGEDQRSQDVRLGLLYLRRNEEKKRDRTPFSSHHFNFWMYSFQVFVLLHDITNVYPN